ncbi:hypothetical protein [Stakelama pacifica]|uniref:Uncharacterized protein n=1 Tax=Stakelama pacifica TaxID=517720 RepID=A0A4R6FXZ9_9SPHN|nr:hypothetical protein [Stakelama pacifica]TDN86843.1 hypothetical protein EV664_101421 [Stakelama pacifica]
MMEKENPRTMAGASDVHLAGNTDAFTSTYTKAPEGAQIIEAIQNMACEAQSEIGRVETLAHFIDEALDEVASDSETVGPIGRLYDLLAVLKLQAAAAKATAGNIESITLCGAPADV